jgi:taurine dioxygenase
MAKDGGKGLPTIEVRPLRQDFGAEIAGIDLARGLNDETTSAILDAWVTYGVLLFRGADFDDDDQMRLSRIFGELQPSATTIMNDARNPFIMTLAYDPEEKDPVFSQHYKVGGIDRAGWLGWHWDQSFMPTIVRGACLRMEKPAREMGETGFIDAIGAYERLSDTMKQRIEGLDVVYELNRDYASGQFGFPKDIVALPRVESNKIQGGDFPPCVHPLVITQKETGRKVLKLSPMHARYILGMDKGESDLLLSELAEHLVDARFAYFHKWQENDILVWDNWRMIHSAEGVPLDCSRSARRTTIVGDYNLGRYLDTTLDRDRQLVRLVD